MEQGNMNYCKANRQKPVKFNNIAKTFVTLFVRSFNVCFITVRATPSIAAVSTHRMPVTIASQKY